jgi:hypothetical protein
MERQRVTSLTNIFVTFFTLKYSTCYFLYTINFYYVNVVDNKTGLLYNNSYQMPIYRLTVILSFTVI